MKTSEPNSGEELHLNWHKRIEKCKDYAASHNNGWKSWQCAYQLYRGDHWSYMTQNLNSDLPSSDNPRNKITVNLVGSNVRTLLPFLLNKRPKFIAHPRLEEFIDNARLQGELLNYYWKEIKAQKEIEKSLLDCIITGHGILETGWAFSSDSNSKTGEKHSYEENVRKDDPYVRAISPYLFFWDFECPSRDLDTSRYVIKAFFRNFEDVLQDESYDPETRKMIEEGEESPEEVSKYISVNPADMIHPYTHEENAPADRIIVLYEIFDKKFNRHLIYAGNVKKKALVDEENPFNYLDGFPFVKIDFIEAPHEPFSFGLPYWIQDPQFELNRVRTHQFEHNRRFNRKYEVVMNDLEDPENGARDLEEGRDGTIIKSKQRGAISPIPDAPMSQDRYNMQEIIKTDIRELTGIDELLRGGALPSRTSATEVNARTNLIGSKLDQYVAKVDEFVEDTGNQILQHCQKWMTEPQLFEIAGMQAGAWIEVPSDKIQSDFQLTLESTSKPRTDPEVEKGQMIQILGSLIQLAQMGIPIDFMKYGKRMFEKLDMKDDADIIMSNVPMMPQGGKTGSPAGPTNGPGAPVAPASSAIGGALGG